MQINLNPNSTTYIQNIQQQNSQPKTDEYKETQAAVSEKYEKTNSINKSYEMVKEPPVTVLKYTNPQTKNVELQIPSELSLKLYKANADYIENLQSKKSSTNIKV